MRAPLSMLVLFLLASLAAGPAPAAGADADGGPLLTLLPGGEALVAEHISLAGAATAGPMPLERPEGLVAETVRASVRGTGEIIPVAFTPPAGGVGLWLLNCIGRTVCIPPPGPGGRTGDLPETGELVAAGDPALVSLGGYGVVPVAAERIGCPGGAGGRYRLELLLPRSAARDAIDLSYRLAGWSWQARHRLDLGTAAGTARLAAVAVLAVPPGVEYDDARLRLAEGDVPRVGRMQVAGAETMAERRSMAMSAPNQVQVSESTTYDLLLFDVPGTWDLRGPAQLSLPLRPARDVKVEDVAVLELYRSPHTPGEEQPIVPRRHLRFKVGDDTPLPAGVIEAGARRSDGTWAPLGEVPTPRVPAGREADVALGGLPDVVVLYRRPELDVLPQGAFQRSAAVLFEIENRRKERTRFELRHELGSPFELIESAPEPVLKEGSALRYALDLAAGQKATIRFRLRFDPRPVRP